jgi:TetR/AcrR family transcriptional repressor of nem operon
MTLGRPIQFNPEQVLESAMSLFWRKGYEATSLQDLLQATGLSKSSLYQAFGNKHGLFERSMERYHSNMLNELQEMLAQADSGKAFLVQFLHGIANETRGKDARRGCLVMNTASEFAQTDPEVARVVKQATKAFGDLFEAAIVRAQEEGDISPEKDARILAKYVVASISGIKTMIKAGATAGEIEAIVAVVLQPLE